MRWWPNGFATLVMFVIGYVQTRYPEQLLQWQRSITPSVMRLDASRWNVVFLRISGSLCFVGALIAAVTMFIPPEE
jgi:hypothetical protein